MKIRVLLTTLLVIVLLTSFVAPFAVAQDPVTDEADVQVQGPEKPEPKEPAGPYVAPTRAGIDAYEYEYEWTGATPIPDAACPTATIIPLTVPDTFTINDVYVGFNAAHTWRSDVQLWVYSPLGTAVQLLDGTQGSLADNFDVLFDDAGGPVDTTNHDIAEPYYENLWAPFAPLSTFAGEDAQGDWELWVCDDTGGDLGEVYRWALFFHRLPSPDFSESYKMAPPKIEVGDPITYTVVISNSGDAPGAATVMTDVLPAGTTLIPGSLTCSFGTCWEDGTAVYWSGEVPAPAAAPAAPQAAVTAPAGAGTATNLLQFAESDAGIDSAVPAALTPDQGPILIDQPPNQSNGIFSDASCDICGSGVQVLAENFVLAGDADIWQIVFWSGYFPGDVPTDPANLTVIFHADDAGGLPGTPIYTENNVAYARAQTGLVLFGVHEWINTLTLATPVSLPAGTYWVEIYDDTGTGTDDMFWEVGNLDPVSGILGQAFAFEAPGAAWTYDGATDMAFQLIGVPNYVTVEFAVETSGVYCGDVVLNEAVITDPAADGPVFVQAATEAWNAIYLHEDFEGPFPPAGWAVIDNLMLGYEWTNTNPGGRDNLTGGSGAFAVVDSDWAGAGDLYDTEMWLPPIDIPASGDTMLVFKTDYNNISPNEIAAVDISLDGGMTWDNLLLWNYDVRGPHTEFVPLSAYAGATGAIIRFYYNDGGTYAWWWEIDDVQIVAACQGPDISIDPPSLSSEQCPEEQVTLDLLVCNSGDQRLNWDVIEWESGFDPFLYDNGPLVTHPGGGAGGADVSALQSSLLMNTLGFGAQYTVQNRLADEFEITDPGGWDVGKFIFYAYQSFAPNDPSPISGLYYQIWDGSPDDPASSVVFGDLVTNQLVDTYWANLYRANETSLLNADRAVMAVEAGAGVHLDPDTYWVDWTFDGSTSFSGPWAPPITILGTDTTGNALQWTDSGGAWGPVEDTGSLTPQGMPFVVEKPEPVFPWLSEDPTAGTVVPGECMTVEVTFDSSGLDPGDYEADLIFRSDDPATPEVVVPVQMTVINCADLEVDPDALESTQAPDVTVDHTLVISNVGAPDLDWSFVDTPAALGLPEYTPPVVNSSTAAGSSYTDEALQPQPSPDVSIPAAPPRYAGPPGLLFYGDRGVFDSDWPGLPVEGFEATLVPPNSVAACTGPFDSTTDNPCFAPGGILDGIRFQSHPTPTEDLVVLTAGFLGVPSAQVGPNSFVDDYDILFLDGGVGAVGLEFFGPLGPDTIDIFIYGSGDVLLGQTTISVPGMPGYFWGVASYDQPITRIHTVSQTGSGELVDDVAFGGDPLECGADFASTDPVSGTIPPGGSTDVTVGFDSTGYGLGTYTGQLCIDSTDPEGPMVVPLTMNVVEPATIASVTWVADGCTVSFDSTVSGEEPFAYTWDFGDGVGASSDADPVYTYATPGGTFTVTLDVYNVAGADTWEGVIEANCTIGYYLPIIVKNY